MKKHIQIFLILLLCQTSAVIKTEEDLTRSASNLDTTHKILKIAIASTVLLPLAGNLMLNTLKKVKLIGKPKTHVGIVSITGPISQNNRYLETIRNFFEDDTIQAIVLKIESPGGAAGSSQALSYEILRLRSKYPKPLVAFVENIAASGAYYVAATADYILATPSAIIGSIGCYLEFPVFKDFLAAHHISFEYIKTGEHKTAGNPMTHLTDNQRQHLQLLNDKVYKQFVDDVYTWRKKYGLSDDTDLWAQGKIFSGEQALTLGLIDGIGCLSYVEEILAKSAELTHPIEWIYPPQKLSLVQLLFGTNNSIKILSSEIIQSIARIGKSALETQPSMRYS